MKISINWIKEYIPNLEIHSFDDFSEKLVSRGIDIETVQFTGEKFSNFIVGEVTEKRKHPNADKLSICNVNTGIEIIQVVCGAPNVAVGMKVCLALPGAVIPDSGFKISEVKLRGELSQGMICSAKELGLSDNHEGILVLNNETETGLPFHEFLNANDYVLDIWVPPNRGDLSSHIGFAREVASAFGLQMKLPETDFTESANLTKDLVSIEIEDNSGCKRFTGRVIKNVKVAESPEWLKTRLINIGLRSINNIVDITNFVMMETGQPLHAFDYDKIRGKKIIVKYANDGDEFVTLDSKRRKLNSGSLMICDKEGYTGIAGIMGGEHSEISSETTNVFLEVAYFDPVVVRKNSKKLNIITDASQRFEKGVDISYIEYVSNRATCLISQIAGGEISKGLYDVYPERFNNIEVGLRNDRLNKVLGEDFTEEEIINSLYSIGIKFRSKDNGYLKFNIPEWRRYDIEREIDLIEEVIRLKGIENLNDDVPAQIDLKNPRGYEYNKYHTKQSLRNFLIGRGFNEILTGSQISREKNKIFNEKCVLIENPHSAEMSAMRTNLNFGMLNVIRNNVNNSGKDISLKLFEIGKVFKSEGDSITESDSLLICLAGINDRTEISVPSRQFSYFDLKGEVDMLMSKINLEKRELFYYYESHNDNGIECIVKLGDKYFGKLRLIGKEILEVFDTELNILTAEFDLSVLYNRGSKRNFYRAISKFPSVKRDLSVVVDESVTYEQIENVFNKSDIKHLNDYKIYDIYRDKKLGNKLSMTFSLEFVSHDKTLTDVEVSNEVDALISNLGKKLNIELRQ